MHMLQLLHDCSSHSFPSLCHACSMLHHAQTAAQVLATLADDAAVDAAVATTTQSSGGAFDSLAVVFENILKVMLACVARLSTAGASVPRAYPYSSSIGVQLIADELQRRWALCPEAAGPTAAVLHVLGHSACAAEASSKGPGNCVGSYGT